MAKVDARPVANEGCRAFIAELGVMLSPTLHRQRLQPVHGQHKSRPGFWQGLMTSARLPMAFIQTKIERISEIDPPVSMVPKTASVWR